MNVNDWAASIFLGENLEDKFRCSSVITSYTYKKIEVDTTTPARGESIKFSKKKIKFPKAVHFKDKSNRAKAIAFFANHELEAIEMMCAALIKFGHDLDEKSYKKLSRGIVSSISDEQRHLRMYVNRLKELGESIDKYPLNDFFWKQFGELSCFDDFFSLMSLTFEAANLDFCLFYEKIFTDAGDFRSASIMREVFHDEIKHVKLGVYWLNKWRNNDSLWNYYVSHLPENISPERSKGIEFSIPPRIQTGLDQDFLNSLVAYKSDFQIPKRKTNSRVVL